jgi:hypothetical protein
MTTLILFFIILPLVVVGALGLAGLLFGEDSRPEFDERPGNARFGSLS